MADQGSEGKFSPFLKQRRFAMALPHIGGGLLDIGCGTGGLCVFCHPDSYVGVDYDQESLDLARKLHPAYRFEANFPPESEKFDSIAALAVIEHVADCRDFLMALAARLRGPMSRIIITTPHPGGEAIHRIGARIGLFSAHANEEHERLLDHNLLMVLAEECSLRVVLYRKFLLGFNQLCVLASI